MKFTTLTSISPTTLPSKLNGVTNRNHIFSGVHFVAVCSEMHSPKEIIPVITAILIVSMSKTGILDLDSVNIILANFYVIFVQ